MISRGRPFPLYKALDRSIPWARLWHILAKTRCQYTQSSNLPKARSKDSLALSPGLKRIKFVFFFIRRKKYLFEWDGEGEWATLFRSFNNLFSDISPRPANRGTSHHVFASRPSGLAGFDAMNYIQKQFRRQIRPPALLLLLNRNECSQRRRRRWTIRRDVRLSAPIITRTIFPIFSSSSSPRYAPYSISNLLRQLPNYRFERHRLVSNYKLSVWTKFKAIYNRSRCTIKQSRE